MLGNAAARVGDDHTCSMIDPATQAPHIGGQITGPGCATVLIEGRPAATAGDACTCTGDSGGLSNSIVEGSTNVFIGGKPAARVGDMCLHGGKVSSGSRTVFIGGGRSGDVRLRNTVSVSAWEDSGISNEPSREEKIEIVKKVIADCIALLEERLPLLVQEEPNTLESFQKWFGPFDQKRKEVIVKRMERQLVFFKELTLDRFSKALDKDYRNTIAYIHPEEGSLTIDLGHLFWNIESGKKYNKAEILMHETSHFENIGPTKDYAYFYLCEKLAVLRPKKALYNADSYLLFLKA